MGRTALGAKIGARIRARREAIGWSQARLAEGVGVTPNYVGAIERGEALPTVQTLTIFARVLGVSAGSLFGDGATKDPWLDELMAVAVTVPQSERPLAMTLLRAVATHGAAGGRRKSRR